VSATAAGVATIPAAAVSATAGAGTTTGSGSATPAGSIPASFGSRTATLAATSFATAAAATTLAESQIRPEIRAWRCGEREKESERRNRS
jgi:hypothetical protein